MSIGGGWRDDRGMGGGRGRGALPSPPLRVYLNFKPTENLALSHVGKTPFDVTKRILEAQPASVDMRWA